MRISNPKYTYIYKKKTVQNCSKLAWLSRYMDSETVWSTEERGSIPRSSNILWHDTRKMKQWSQNRRSLLGDDYASNNRVNSVARQRRCQHAFPTLEKLFSAWSVQSAYKEEFSWEELSRVSRRQPARIRASGQRDWIESSLRNWQLQNNGKKGIRRCKEDFICDLKWRTVKEICCQDTTSEDWEP
jgi:hypothetical protein